MLVNVTGTILFGEEESYDLTGILNQRGNRLIGSLTFDDDHSKVIPLSVTIVGAQVRSTVDQYFVDTTGLTVRIFAIQLADTSITADFSSIEISAEAERDGEEVELTIELASQPALQESDSLTEPAVPSGPIRKAPNKRRINEVANLIDHFGAIVSLPRAKLEGNAAYAARIKQTISRRPNSTYNGLVNGMASDLGLSILPALNVQLRASTADAKPTVRLVVDDFKISLYRQWVGNIEQAEGYRPILEKEALFSHPDISTLGHLVDWINTSENYTATLTGDGNLLSKFLIKTDSRNIGGVLIGQEINELGVRNVIKGSLNFSKTRDFQKEIPLEEDLAAEGEFSVDYIHGLIYVHTKPAIPLRASFLYSSSSIDLEYCPLKLINLSEREVQKNYFNQIDKSFYTNIADQTKNGLPTNEFYEIIRDVLTVGNFDQYWGE